MSETQEFTLRAMATNYSGGHSWDHLDTEACAKAADEIKALRQKLFPYAEATEISGISWDGKYLIGDKASISFFHEMKNRGEQIDVYKRAYDQNIASKDAEVARLREALEPLMAVGNAVLSGAPSDATAWLNVSLDEIRQSLAALKVQP